MCRNCGAKSAFQYMYRTQFSAQLVPGADYGLPASVANRNSSVRHHGQPIRRPHFGRDPIRRPAAERSLVLPACRRFTRGEVVRQPQQPERPACLRARRRRLHALRRHRPAGGVPDRHQCPHHRLARRAGAARPWRQHDPARPRCSSICATATPSPTTRSRACNGRGPKAAKARRRRSVTTRQASCLGGTWDGHRQEQA